MVRVQGKMKRTAKAGGGYFKIDENFRTKKEADRYVKILSVGERGGAAKGTGITEYRKPKRRTTTSVFGSSSNKQWRF
jgi:hypothetical protein